VEMSARVGQATCDDIIWRMRFVGRITKVTDLCHGKYASILRYTRTAYLVYTSKTKLNSVALVRTRTIPTERPPPVGKLVPTFADRGVSRGQRNGSPQPLISVF